MTKRKTKTAIARRNAWIKREHAALIERTKQHEAISFQATLDDFIEDALRQRLLIPTVDQVTASVTAEAAA